MEKRFLGITSITIWRTQENQSSLWKKTAYNTFTKNRTSRTFVTPSLSHIHSTTAILFRQPHWQIGFAVTLLRSFSITQPLSSIWRRMNVFQVLLYDLKRKSSPMQYFWFWLWMNPGLQRQKYEPSVLTHLPFSQTPSSSHSSLSSHWLVSKFLACPSGHSHVNDPIEFTHCPPSQRWGMASHSFISRKISKQLKLEHKKS